jgi:hypothetical protein
MVGRRCRFLEIIVGAVFVGSVWHLVPTLRVGMHTKVGVLHCRNQCGLPVRYTLPRRSMGARRPGVGSEESGVDARRRGVGCNPSFPRSRVGMHTKVGVLRCRNQCGLPMRYTLPRRSMGARRPGVGSEMSRLMRDVAGLDITPRSHAPAWECIRELEYSAAEISAACRCGIHSHAGAWERDVAVDARCRGVGSEASRSWM